MLIKAYLPSELPDEEGFEGEDIRADTVKITFEKSDDNLPVESSLNVTLCVHPSSTVATPLPSEASTKRQTTNMGRTSAPEITAFTAAASGASPGSSSLDTEPRSSLPVADRTTFSSAPSSNVSASTKIQGTTEAHSKSSRQSTLSTPGSSTLQTGNHTILVCEEMTGVEDEGFIPDANLVPSSNASAVQYLRPDSEEAWQSAPDDETPSVTLTSGFLRHWSTA